jgi:hypothetical protein
VDPAERDLCRFEAVAAAATRGDANGALVQIRAISSPMVRGAALSRAFTLAPEGWPMDEAVAACASLPPPQDEACMKTWNRPHLWEEGAR